MSYELENMTGNEKKLYSLILWEIKPKKLESVIIRLFVHFNE
jgi:hypothetical protein